jgi:4-hydroxybenzoate polyprenyltransferase
VSTSSTRRPSFGRDLAQILVSSRPISWINTAFPFAAAYFLTTREFDVTLVVGFLYFLIPYNLAMYGINDVFDYASDLANPRKGGIEGALLAPRLHRPTLWAAAVSNLPFLAYLVAVGNAASTTWLAISVFAVIAYSAPVLRFKERPFLDSITSSLHFVTPAIVGLALSGAAASRDLVLVLVAFFLWGMAAHAFGAVQDVGPDREAGIGSVATVIGARATVRMSLVLWLLAGILMLFTAWPGPLGAFLALPYLINAAPWWRVTDERSGDTNRAWRRFIALNYFAGFLATMILILAWVS